MRDSRSSPQACTAKARATAASRPTARPGRSEYSPAGPRRAAPPRRALRRHRPTAQSNFPAGGRTDGPTEGARRRPGRREGDIGGRAARAGGAAEAGCVWCACVCEERVPAAGQRRAGEGRRGGRPPPLAPRGGRPSGAGLPASSPHPHPPRRRSPPRGSAAQGAGTTWVTKSRGHGDIPGVGGTTHGHDGDDTRWPPPPLPNSPPGNFSPGRRSPAAPAPPRIVLRGARRGERGGRRGVGWGAPRSGSRPAEQRWCRDGHPPTAPTNLFFFFFLGCRCAAGLPRTPLA